MTRKEIHKELIECGWDEEALKRMNWDTLKGLYHRECTWHLE